MSVTVPEYFKPTYFQNKYEPPSLRAVVTVAGDGEATGIGAILWGTDFKEAFWLGGYASADYLLRAEMVSHLLHNRSHGLKLFIYTKGLQEPLNNANRAIKRNGRTLTRKRLIGYELLRPLAEARTAGLISIGGLDWIPCGARAARDVAMVGLQEVAEKKDCFPALKADFPHWHVVASSFAEPAIP